MTREELKLKAEGLRNIIQLSVDNFFKETGFHPIIETRTTIVEGYGDCAGKQFTDVVIKVEL